MFTCAQFFAIWGITKLQYSSTIKNSAKVIVWFYLFPSLEDKEIKISRILMNAFQ